MNSLPSITTTLTHSLAWALLHSLWQGLAIYAVLYAVVKALPGMGSRLKYYCSLSGFFALFAWFASTWASQFQSMKVVATMPALNNNIGTFMPDITDVSHAASTTAPSSTLWSHLTTIPEQYNGLIIALYLLGLAFMLFRFAINLKQIGNLNKEVKSIENQQWDAFISRWQQQLGINRQVKLYLSDKINVPMMLGNLKPVILLPMAAITTLSVDQIEAILLHELAHIKRHDYLVNLLQTAGEALLFFNPFVWLLSSQIRNHREECCDDLVVANTTNPLPYVKALAILETNRTNDTQLTLAATGNNNQLLNRIKRIMNMKKKNINYSQLTIVVVAFFAAAITLATLTFSPSFAQKAKGAKSETLQKKKTIIIEHTASDGHNGKTENEDVTKVKKDNQEIKTIIINNERSGETSKIDIDSLEEEENYLAALEKPDTTTFAIRLEDSTMINAKLFDNPLPVKRIFKGIHITMFGANQDFDKMEKEIRRTLNQVYSKIKDPKLQTIIDKEVTKLMHEERNLKSRRKQGGSNIQPTRSEEIRTKTMKAIEEMGKEGIINTKGHYKVEKTTSGDFYVNDKKAPRRVYDKYANRFENNSSIEVYHTDDKK